MNHMQPGYAIRAWICRALAVGATAAIILLGPRAHADELERINQTVNAEIAPGPDAGWRPVNGRGDCKAYAGEKYRRMSARGYPVEIWVADAPGGEMHAMDVVGDRVFDNLTSWSASRRDFEQSGYLLLFHCRWCEDAAR